MVQPSITNGRQPVSDDRVGITRARFVTVAARQIGIQKGKRHDRCTPDGGLL